MKRQVVKDRAKLTLEQLNTVKIDDSFGSLVCYAETKWFPTLFEKHNDRGSDHLDMYDVFVIGKDINATEDIVYLNFSSLWHLCNILRNLHLTFTTESTEKWALIYPNLGFTIVAPPFSHKFPHVQLLDMVAAC